MYLSRLPSAALILAVVACATPPSRSASSRKQSVETLPDGSQLVCEMEKPTGSHIAEQVCRRVVPAGFDVARTQTRNNAVQPRSAVSPPGTP